MATYTAATTVHCACVCSRRSRGKSSTVGMSIVADTRVSYGQSSDGERIVGNWCLERHDIIVER